jgi:hypothetical protein
MSAALLTKLKAAGRPKGTEAELERFQSWLPPDIQPVNSAIRGWIRRFKAGETVSERLRLESEALEDIQRRLLHLRDGAHKALLVGFTDMIARGMDKGMQARQQALAGTYIEPEFEDQLEDHVQQWLRKRERGPQRAMAGYLLRLMEAWKRQRRAETEPDGE